MKEPRCCFGFYFHCLSFAGLLLIIFIKEGQGIVQMGKSKDRLDFQARFYDLDSCWKMAQSNQYGEQTN
jgi:hypothetical protein